MRAGKEGIVKRSVVKNEIYNKLTTDGKRILKFAEEIGVLIMDEDPMLIVCFGVVTLGFM